MRKLHCGIQNQHGVTLLETLFSVGIVLVMTASFYQLLSSFSHHYEVQEAIAETQQQGRVAEDLFWQEVRNTGLDPRGTLFNSNPKPTTKLRKVRRKSVCEIKNHDVQRIFEASPSTFHFLADLNGNGRVNGNGGPDYEEHIRYEWVDSSEVSDCSGKKRSNTLYRDTGGGMYEAATNIVEFNLSYFDEDGNPLDGNPLFNNELDSTQRESIRRVVLDLTTEMTHRSTKEAIRRTLSTDIWLRNM